MVKAREITTQNNFNTSSMLNHRLIKEALLIRRTEEKFLQLFSEGKLNGTVHTCIGQEFSAIAFAGQLNKQDFVFSNHRCHGHYISFTKDYKGLIAELIGKNTGVCAGIGGSQHLCNNNFFSNGIQGGIAPVASGIALAQKLSKNTNIVVVYIGDGTLGEGVLYETLNLISKWNIPILIVCENNQYAQSTPQSVNLAGNILKRAEAFGIRTSENDTWNIDELLIKAKETIEYVRNNSKPAFHLVNTYRLGPHSKGDDFRDKKEIDEYKGKDILSTFLKNDSPSAERFLKEIDEKIESCVEEVFKQKETSIDEYYNKSKEIVNEEITWTDLLSVNERQVNLLNAFFNEAMEADEKILFIGEDILSPYGGAFKVAKNLSEKYPKQVFSTPISEAAIVGISNGLALAGFKPFVEIMFGDFITLAFDQIVNHASKFYYMYNKQVNCPIVIRTPMGGGRGYGPTHSQTLDKLLLGIDNIKVIALSDLINPKLIYKDILNEKHPVIVIENKVDYGKKINSILLENYQFLVSNRKYPDVRITPLISIPTATIITYGGLTEQVINCLPELFIETGLKAELLILSQISPINCWQTILESVNKTKKVYVVEEGSIANGFGSEILSYISENTTFKVKGKRIGALSVPIPSVKSLEEAVLPDSKTIIEEIKKTL